MGKDKGAKQKKKLGKLTDLPVKAKRAAGVKGGLILPYIEQDASYNKDKK